MKKVIFSTAFFLNILWFSVIKRAEQKKMNIFLISSRKFLIKNKNTSGNKTYFYFLSLGHSYYFFIASNCLIQKLHFFLSLSWLIIFFLSCYIIWAFCYWFNIMISVNSNRCSCQKEKNSCETKKIWKIINKLFKPEIVFTWSYLPIPSARAGYDTRSIFKAEFSRFELRVFLLLD